MSSKCEDLLNVSTDSVPPGVMKETVSFSGLAFYLSCCYMAQIAHLA